MLQPQEFGSKNSPSGLLQQYIAQQKAQQQVHQQTQQQTALQPVYPAPQVPDILNTLHTSNISNVSTVPTVPIVPSSASILVPPAAFLSSIPVEESVTDPTTEKQAKRKRIARIIAVVLTLVLAVAIYFVWNEGPSTTGTDSATSVSQQNFTASTTTVNTSSSTGDQIRVYVVGAVKHPGIYVLSQDARVYDLLQAAGGPLSTANLVSINLAAKLSDGEEVYIAQVGETPPATTNSQSSTGTTNSTSTSTGSSSSTGTSDGSSDEQLIDINTATVDELTQGLHVSTKTANTIVNYRIQNGNFASVDELSRVVSASIYAKIKAHCTV